MSRIDDILKSGRAPGLNTRAKDPTSADVAVPRAFRQLEQSGMPMREIERQSGFKAKQIKKVWKFD